MEKRGYNQSMEIAIGVSKITHIPIIKNAILRILHNPTQTQLQKNERIKNVSGIGETLFEKIKENETKRKELEDLYNRELEKLQEVSGYTIERAKQEQNTEE